MPSVSEYPYPIMTSTVRLCKRVGLWNDSDLRKPCRQALFILACLIFWYILPNVMFIIRKEKTLDYQLKSILEVFAIIVFVLRISAHMLHRGTLQRCYLEVQNVLSDYTNSLHEDVQSTLKHLHKSAENLLKYYLFGVMSQASLYGGVPAVVTIFKYLTQDEVPMLPSTVLESDFILFDHLSNFWIWLPTMLISIAVQYIMITIMTANECLYWNLLHHVSCLFKIIGMEISRLDNFNDPKLFKERLVTIVENHEVCYRSSRRLESSLSPVMAMLYCSCVLQTCYIMFVVTMVDDLFLIAMMMFVLQYTIFLIFTFSMLGTELTEASIAVSDAIYNMRWYERSVIERRLLLFMQIRSQKKVAISAAKFFHLTRGSFAGAMRSAMSYFTIMQQFYGRP